MCLCGNAQGETAEFESVLLQGKVLLDSIKSASLIERKNYSIFSTSPFLLGKRENKTSFEFPEGNSYACKAAK